MKKVKKLSYSILSMVITLSMALSCFTFAAVPAVAATTLTTYGETDNANLMPTYAAANNAVTESPAWLAGAVINEVRIDTATAEGTFSAMNKLLPYYEEMGINCLWIEPVNDKAANKNYYTNYGLHTIDLTMSEASTYEEGWENFGKFVANAHRHNIRIMLDVVMWGVETSAPMISDSNYSGVVSNIENQWGGYSFNYNSSAFQDYYTNTMLDIIETTNIDGIRVDLAPHITNCSNLLLRIRQESYTSGHAIAIMSEDYTTDRTGGTGSLVYDLQQVGVLDSVNKDYWTAEQIGDETDNWVISTLNPVNYWLTTTSGRDIVTTTKNGKLYYGSASQQTAGTTGQNPYYTYALSYHDQPTVSSTNVLRFGYQAILAPVIPLWYTGDEFGYQGNNGGVAGNYYTNGYINPDLASDVKYGEFQSKVKKLMNIRRTYADIFEYAPANHKNTNICAVSVSGISTYQAYARYANGKAILVVPNGTNAAADITVTVPVSDAGISGSYTATNLMSGAALNVSNNQVVVPVAAGDLAVILVDNGATATKGSENYVAANAAAKTAFTATDAGSVWQMIENLGQVDINSVSAIAAAESAYAALSSADKAKVDNYDKLLRARKAINAIFASGNSDYSYGLSQRSLFPDNATKSSWGWGSYVNISENAKGGVSVDYLQSVDANYRIEMTKAVQLDGAHLHLTVDSSREYSDKVLFVRLTSVHGDVASNNNVVQIKLDTAGGQIFFASGGSVDHSGMPGYNPSYTDRVFTGSAFYSIDMKFAIDAGGNLLVTINDVTYSISAAEFARATDVSGESAVHFQIAPGGKPAYSIDFMHGGEENCFEAVTQTGNCDELIPTEDMFRPVLSAWGWTNAVTRTSTPEGVRVQALTGTSGSYQNWVRTPVSLNGAHLKFTVNSTGYTNRLMFMKLSNSGNNATNAGLFYRIDPDGSQLTAGIDSYGYGAAIDCSGYANCYPGFTDRLHVPTVLNSSTNEYEITFSVGLDNSITMTINGFAFTVKAEDWQRNTGLTNLESVYIGFGPIGGQLDYTLNLFHGGKETCPKLIGEINAAYTAAGGNTNIRTMANLWAKVNGLSTAGRTQVEKYLAIASAAHYATNANIYKTARADFSDYNWGGLTYTESAEGLTINNTYTSAAYAPWTTNAFDLDGFEMSFRRNSGNNIYLYFCSNNDRNNAADNKAGIGFRLYFEVGKLVQMYIYGTNGIIDHSSFPGYNAAIATNRVFLNGLLTENNGEYTIKTAINEDGDLVFRINNYQITIPSDAFSEKLTNTANVKMSIHPLVDASNYTIHYLRNGAAFDYATIGSGILPDFAAGDVNADGEVNILDLVRMKKAIASPGTVPHYSPAADLDEPAPLSALNAADLAAVRQLLLF